jgi:hypothetical protein
VTEIAGAGVQGGHLGDCLGQAVGWGTVCLGAEHGEQLGAEPAGEPGRAMPAPGAKPGRDRGAVDHHHGAGGGTDEVLIAIGFWGGA